MGSLAPTLRWFGDREDERDRTRAVIWKSQQTPETVLKVNLDDARDEVQTLRVLLICWLRRLIPYGECSSPLYAMGQGCMASFVW